MVNGPDINSPPKDALFIAAKGAQALHQSVEPSAVTLADVVQYIRGNPNIDVERVQSALSQSLGIRKLFNQLIRTEATAVLPKEAQADDGVELTERKGENFTLQFKTSNASAEQVYVLLSLDQHIVPSTDCSVTLIVNMDELKEKKYQTERLVFDGILDCKVQKLFMRNDPVLALLRNPESNVLIRVKS